MTNLDIIIPVYNEGANIISALNALREKVRTPFRVLICFDHDNDDTLPALQNYASREPEIVFVKNESKGVLGAVLTGFRRSTAPAVLVMPADDDYNAEIIDVLVRKFEDGSDVVCPSRFMRGGCMKGCPWLKAFLVRISAFTLCHFGRVPTHDPSNGFRLFSRRVIETIPVETVEGCSYSLELLVKSHRMGWKITEVPAKWFQRRTGQSRFHILIWLPGYLRWYFYAFATSYLGRKSHV